MGRVKMTTKSKLLISYTNVIDTLRKMDVSEILDLISLTDGLYACAKRRKDVEYIAYEINLDKLDEFDIPKSIESKIDITFLLSLLRNGIRPRRIIGRGEILDYAISKYRTYEKFATNEPILLSIIEMKSLTEDLKSVFREIT
jgi:hypothetical protein